jgi:hypothetical protein
MKFAISHKHGVIAQIHALQVRAKQADIEAAYVGALKQIIRHLQTHPLEWGDPEYRQKHEGSVVCHGIVEMLFVRFAVYEIEEKVHILDIRPIEAEWPNSK